MPANSSAADMQVQQGSAQQHEAYREEVSSRLAKHDLKVFGAIPRSPLLRTLGLDEVAAALAPCQHVCQPGPSDATAVEHVRPQPDGLPFLLWQTSPLTPLAILASHAQHLPACSLQCTGQPRQGQGQDTMCLCSWQWLPETCRPPWMRWGALKGPTGRWC